jgi:nucleoside-diphosphate-sugar epimerase
MSLFLKSDEGPPHSTDPQPGLRPVGRTILLTGGTGVVGRAVLPLLTDSAVIGLVHRAPLASPDVESLEGDLTLPRLGLSRTSFRNLAERIDCIIHSGAVTNFSLPPDSVRAANVGGTEQILELAALAHAPLYHVSTAFIQPSSRSSREPNVYELSKREGEALVRSSGLPHIIVRPSMVIGDSQSGEISQFQGIYLMVGLFLRGLLPLVPADPSTYVDYIPRDTVARAIAALVARHVTSGEWWLTAGQAAPTLEEVAGLCTRHARHLLGQPVQPPRLVSPEVFDRLIGPAFLPALPDRLRKTLERALEVSRYSNLAEPFPSSLPELESELGLEPLADPSFTLLRSLDYWARSTGFGIYRRARANEVAPRQEVAAHA